MLGTLATNVRSFGRGRIFKLTRNSKLGLEWPELPLCASGFSVRGAAVCRALFGLVGIVEELPHRPSRLRSPPMTDLVGYPSFGKPLASSFTSRLNGGTSSRACMAGTWDVSPLTLSQSHHSTYVFDCSAIPHQGNPRPETLLLCICM